MSQGATRKKILLIEDDEAIRQTLRLALEFEGYSVLTAANGKEGIEILQRIEPPSLILLDLMMPVMNGWQFLEIRAKEEIATTVPVVVITAFADRTQGIGAQAIIKKPISLDAFLAVINEHCLEAQT